MIIEHLPISLAAGPVDREVVRLSPNQCDQIWRFLDFGQLFKAFGNN